MKSAASCETSCDTQDFANHRILERLTPGVEGGVRAVPRSRAPLTQCREAQTVKGGRPLAAPPPSLPRERKEGAARVGFQHSTPPPFGSRKGCVGLGARGLGPQGALERLRPQKRSSSHCSQQEPPSCFGGAARVRDPLSSPAWREGLLRPAALTREARFRGAPWACSHAKHGPGPSGCVRLPE